MVLQLAEHYYHDPVILENLMIGQFDQPITVSTRAGIDTVHVPEILEPVPGASLMVRGSSVELVALLESGDLDFTFEYESVVKQHGLRYVQLPPQIDLGDARWDKSYAHVAVKIDYQRFATVVPVFRGEAIAYALTIPSNAPDPAAARAFVAFALGPEGRRILKRYHQPVIVPPVADGYDHLPAQLRAVCSRPH
jgi:molybdate/tungstate transport system substrate-binding protein